MILLLKTQLLCENKLNNISNNSRNPEDSTTYNFQTFSKKCLPFKNVYLLNHFCMSCVSFCSGHMVMADSFNSALFKQTFQRVFSKDEATDTLKMAFNASLEVKCSRELKVSGAIGACVSMDKKDSCISEVEIGIGKDTNLLHFCANFG